MPLAITCTSPLCHDIMISSDISESTGWNLKWLGHTERKALHDPGMQGCAYLDGVDQGHQKRRAARTMMG